MATGLATREKECFVVRPARHQVRFPVLVTHNAFVGTSEAEGVCTDLNNFGVGADVAEPLQVGEVVRLDIGLPAGDLQTFARVIYRNSYHYGFYFVDTEPEQRELLDLTLATLNSRTSMIQ